MNLLPEILSKSKPVLEITNFDSKNFKNKYLDKNTPVILKGYGNNWPAKEKWSFDFLLNLDDETSVPLEIGASNQNKTNFFKQSFREYIQSLKESELNNDNNLAYLAQFNLFTRFPHLESDIDFSIFGKYVKRTYPNAWIGPKGTISGLHVDTLNNLLGQVKGRKLVLLASPKFNKDMYITKKYEFSTVASEVDINNYDEKKYPKIRDVEFFNVTLNPGDTLFIPKGWWHYVTSLDSSISISQFVGLFSDLIYHIPLEKIKYSLHYRGYYKKNNCCCHMIVNGKL